MQVRWERSAGSRRPTSATCRRTKSQIIAIVEDSLRTLEAFARAFEAVTFVREKMAAGALDGYTVATDVADALIAQGVTARAAHALVGAAVARAESERRALDAGDCARLAGQGGIALLQAPLDARASIEAKKHARLDGSRRGATADRLVGIGDRQPADAAVTRVHVTGAAGYAAAEALRWLHAHPFVEVGIVESRSHSGERLGEHFPLLRDRTVPLRGTGQRAAERLRGRHRDRRPEATMKRARSCRSCSQPALRVIDLSADYRCRCLGSVRIERVGARGDRAARGSLPIPAAIRRPRCSHCFRWRMIGTPRRDHRRCEERDHGCRTQSACRNRCLPK